MKTAIFIRSYEKDFQWLFYCLRSIHKFASGFSEIVVAVPEGQESQLRHLTAERVIAVHDGQPGYLGQQVTKLGADIHTGADFVFNLDSDCVLTKPITPQMFMVGDKPRWLITPWKDCMEVKRHWFHVMAKCCQEAPAHEFMRRHGIMIPAWGYKAFREFIEQTHGITMDAYVMNQPQHEFSEFNCIGFYLWLYHRNRIAWHDTSVDGIPECQIEQAWSWSGMTDGWRKRMDALLA